MPHATRFSQPNLPMQLLALRERLMQRFRPILASAGLTEQQWRVLRALDEQDGLEPRELCERCVILSPSLVGIITRMQAEKLLIKKNVAQDQRRVRVFLSAKAKRLIGQLNPQINDVYGALQARLGKQVMQNLQTDLGLFYQGLEDESR
jgi:homoprotocatechuate degradation regulator HpaR